MHVAAKLSAVALAATFAFAAPASAQSVNFVGSTMGCFYTVAMCTPVASSTLGGGSLSFNAGTFDVTTSNGFVGVGNLATNTNNFGSFSLPTNATPQTVPGGTNFLLHIMFTSPDDVSPNPVPFMAAVSGSVTANAGGYFINFDNDPTAITWTGGSGTLWVNDVSINNNGAATAVSITGNITAVPEPMSLALLATGMGGLLVSARRRRVV